MEPQRTSKSNDAVREAERMRIRAMTPPERILLALRLGRRDRALRALMKRTHGG